ncbi:MAG TPA: DUF2892 domain-containing protein [Bacteroidales bacterium]|nr:DUF2892 domain-containing protein [Bacteroidales bacterium]
MNNVGRIDRTIRIILAVGILILHSTQLIPEDYSNTSLVVAGLLAFTSLRKCCPLYALLGFGTCQTGTSNSNPRIKTKKLNL